jgi:hypothetical protein
MEEGQERLFNELTHKWLEYVRHFYLHARQATLNFKHLENLYYNIYHYKFYDLLPRFQALLREEGY